MAIHYNLDNRLGTLSKMLDEYNAWFIEVGKSAMESGEAPPTPDTFEKWLDDIDIEAFNIDGQYSKQRDRLVIAHERMVAAKDFNEVAEHFRKFMAGAQSFCQNVILEEWGLDLLTGLKNRTILHRDYMIEMERLAREGFPFSIGLARIDDFAEMEKSLPVQETHLIIKNVATIIQKSLRSYDDAYRISRDHFVLCLKQSDIIGGQKALERLRDELEESKETYDLDGKPKLISMSCVVASPHPGDDMTDLMDNLYVDLDKQVKDHGSVLTYQELSPLQRFMQKEKDE